MLEWQEGRRQGPGAARARRLTAETLHGAGAQAAQLLERVHSQVQVDVLAGAAVIGRLLLVQRLGTTPAQPAALDPEGRRRPPRPGPTPPAPARLTHLLYGFLVGGAELETLLNKQVEIALADDGGDFAPKLFWDNGLL